MVGQSIEDKNLRLLMIVLSVVFGLGISLIGILDFIL